MTTAAQSALGAWTRVFLATALLATFVVGEAPRIARGDAITDENVTAALDAAKTPADHQALAEYFRAKAQAAQADVELHQTMATAFSGKAQAIMAAHCKSLVKLNQQAVKEYTALANEQANLAK